ncbi:hypothetical protein PS918_00458 [Pseudomonas fluorescens]|uniref:Uncharacterized protein n=1 Tax=Pseudomonas fluorescens TaxID=294 RepID=A0A5E7QZE5_PSEFL|nr:hypothetical protein [Pseudomonas fluorescens]VVP66825.1 hypothetical protein PS918_00458 [Pseudomonas fluorescens]
MRNDFTNNQVVTLACVYLTKNEHYPLDCYIGQYINTRNLRSVPDIDTLLSSTLEGYPGRPPVMVNELNAWIDKTLGYRAAHPDFLSLLDV